MVNMTHNKKTLVVSLFFIIAMLGGKLAFASSTINGIWKHATKPAYIEFDLNVGIASVREHQTHQENKGLTVIKDIAASSTANNEWEGQMYNGYLDRYVSVTIKLYEDSVSIFDTHNDEVLKLVKE